MIRVALRRSVVTRAISGSRVGPVKRATAHLARLQFLDPASRRFYPDWDQAADIAVAIRRTEAGRNPHDKELHDLVGELSTRSDDFRTRWGAHNVRHHGTGTKRFRHHTVGDLTLAIYTAEPGSPAEEGLRLLATGLFLERRERISAVCSILSIDTAAQRRPRGARAERALARIEVSDGES